MAARGDQTPPSETTRMRWVLAAARRVTRGTPRDPEDLAQDVIVSLGGDLSRVASPAFAGTVARRRLADLQRSELGRTWDRPGKALEWEAAQPRASEPEAPAEGPEPIPGLARLGPVDRQIVTWTAEGLSAVQIAQRLGRAAQTVRERRALALRRLEAARVVERIESAKKEAGAVERSSRRLSNFARFQGAGNRTAAARNGKAKLTWEIVREIRRRRDEGQAQKKVAREMNINDATVNDVWKNKTWREET